MAIVGPRFWRRLPMSASPLPDAPVRVFREPSRQPLPESNDPASLGAELRAANDLVSLATAERLDPRRAEDISLALLRLATRLADGRLHDRAAGVHASGRAFAASRGRPWESAAAEVVRACRDAREAAPGAVQDPTSRILAAGAARCDRWLRMLDDNGSTGAPAPLDPRLFPDLGVAARLLGLPQPVAQPLRVLPAPPESTWRRWFATPDGDVWLSTDRRHSRARQFVWNLHDAAHLLHQRLVPEQARMSIGSVSRVGLTEALAMAVEHRALSELTRSPGGWLSSHLEKLGLARSEVRAVLAEGLHEREARLLSVQTEWSGQRTRGSRLLSSATRELLAQPATREFLLVPWLTWWYVWGPRSLGGLDQVPEHQRTATSWRHQPTRTWWVSTPDDRAFARALARATDVPAQTSAHALPLERVGIQRIQRPLLLDGFDGPFSAEIALGSDLDADRRGIHMSRLAAAALNGDDVWNPHIAVLARTLAETARLGQDATSAHATIDASGFDRTVASVSARPSLEPLRVVASATVANAASSAVVEHGLEVAVLTACPCTQAYHRYVYARAIARCAGEDAARELLEEMPAGTHVQRCAVKVTIEDPNGDIPTFELLAAVDERCARAQTVLKRPDEHRLVGRVLAHPQFTEDVVRELAIAVAARCSLLPRHRMLTVEAIAEESIHPHDATARLRLPLDEIRRAC